MLNDLEQRICAQANDRGGCLRLNFADPDHYAFFMEEYGGEDRVKRLSPTVYAAINAQRAGEVAVEDEDELDPKDTVYFENVHVEESVQVNSEKTDLLADDDTVPCDTRCVTHFVQRRAAIDVKAGVYNVKGEQIASTNTSYMDTKDTVTAISGEYARLVPGDQYVFLSKATVSSICQKNGSPQVQVDVASMTSYRIANQESVVSSFTCQHPTGTADPAQVKVSYLRDTQLKKYDYSIPNMPDNNNTISIKLPVEVTLQVEPDYRILRLSEKNGYRLYLDAHKGGVFHCMVPLKDLTFDVKSSSEGTDDILTLALPEPDKKVRTGDWRNRLDFSTVEEKSSAGCDIYGCFNVIVNAHHSQPERTVTVTINSNLKSDMDKSNIRVKRIFLQWGCMAKDTRILMYDASTRAVSELKPGDVVLSGEGDPLVVRDISSGPEKILYRIVTDDGGSIRLSGSHPLLTTTGPQPAKRVQSGQFTIKTGGDRRITEVRTEDYNDVVYNLIFDQPSTIYGNDFLIGDHDMQQQDFDPEPVADDLTAETLQMSKELLQLAEHC